MSTAHAHGARDGLFCAAIAAACLLASYPVAEIGFVDDWSYIKTALDFARTGHFIFNGWATAMLGWQVVWGALFIKLFGFSFTVVRSSEWLVALASVFLFHQILLRFGVAPRDAVFGTLTLGISPLFLPLAASYMTDVPGLFAVLVCIYMCQRAVAAKSDRATLLWLCSAALVNVAGGTVRQIAWLGALVMVPSTAWLLRRRRAILPAGILLWAASLAGVFACMDWFSRQPYSESEAGIVGVPIRPTMFLHLGVTLLKTLLCLLFVLLPVLVAWLPAARSLSLKSRRRIAGFGLAIIVIYIFLGFRGLLEGNILPWISHILMQSGMAPAPGSTMLGSAPAIFPVWVRVAISVIVIVAVLIFAEVLFCERMLQKINRSGKTNSSWRDVAWILGPYAISYLALLLPRAIHGLIFDRYLLGLMIVAIVALLKLYEQQFSAQLSGISWFVLALFALCTIAATHDWFALNRARVAAAAEIHASGIPRRFIQGGLEYDGWTQIEDGGHANSPFVRVPAQAYDPNVQPLPLAPACRLGYTSFTPLVKPKYFLTLGRMNCLASSNFSPVEYRAWLPPFQRTVYIQQLPRSSK